MGGAEGNADLRFAPWGSLFFEVKQMRKKRRSYTDAECSAAFLAYMAEKASLLGMNDTVFANASGLTTESRSTPQDLLKLGLAVCANPRALDIWSTPDRDFSVSGVMPRTVHIKNTVISLYGSAIQAAGYLLLGGKSGSLFGSTFGGEYDRAGVLLAEISGTPVILSLMAKGQTSFENIDKAAKELCDMVSESLCGRNPPVGETLATLVSAGGGYAACAVPSVPGEALKGERAKEFPAGKGSLAGSPSAVCRPASTTKVMTMLCALDCFADESETLFVKGVDIAGGSGSCFYRGDRLSFSDALRIMMMESSNTLANTISRCAGEVILSGHTGRVPLKYRISARIYGIHLKLKQYKSYVWFTAWLRKSVLRKAK